MVDEKSENITDQVKCLTITDGNCFSLLRKSEGKNDEIIALMVTHRNDPEYKMNHKYRGLALIFAHENFDKLERRPETDVDHKNLKEVLGQLDFKVKVYKDLRYEDVKKKIDNAAGMDHNKHDCILVAVLTHGDSDLLSAKDKYYKMDDIWNAFAADKCRTLAGKPKLFIVQASQCKPLDPESRMKSKQHIETDSVNHYSSSYKIPIYADFLIAFSQIPGASSDSEHGSWFIKSLCNELSASGKKLDLLMLLTFVAQRVAVDFETYDEDYKQITCTMSTLTRILRFADEKQATSP